MKRFQFFVSSLIFTFLALGILASCKDSDDVIKPTESLSIEKNIPGKWLLASSEASQWTTYDFQSSGTMTCEWYDNKGLHSGAGMYFTNEGKATLTGSISYGKNNYIYIDWVVKNIGLFQIDIDIYGENGNQLIQSSSLYKILEDTEIVKGEIIVPDYRGMCGSNDYSEFTSLDPEIVSIDKNSGQITGLKPGIAFITFKTPRGIAAISVNVVEKALILAENIQGTWVTDDKGNIWERDVFGPDGYFFSNWSRKIIYPTDNESAQGTYTVDGATQTITVSAKTPYNMRLNSEYRIQQFDLFSFYTHIYSGGDKTGEFYYQRMIDTIGLKKGESNHPDYLKLTENIAIMGYSSHDTDIATVDETGEIKALAAGMTYIDVLTSQGNAVIEISVE